jgi:hypothetical protein
MTVARGLGARRLTTAVLLIGIGIGAAGCEFGEHRGSHSNVYPEDSRYEEQRPVQPAYQQPAYRQPGYPVYQPAPVYRPAY